jgi:hypothetical protein
LDTDQDIEILLEYLEEAKSLIILFGTALP